MPQKSREALLRKFVQDNNLQTLILERGLWISQRETECGHFKKSSAFIRIERIVFPVFANNLFHLPEK